MNNTELLLPIILPIISGIIFMFLKKFVGKPFFRFLFVLSSALSSFFAIMNVFGAGKSLLIFTITDDIPILLKLDEMGMFFSVLTSIIWFLVSIYTVRYFDHEEREHQFFGFYLITFGVLMALDYSGNIITLYMFFEVLTMVTLGLVIHSRTKEAVNATIKYLLYSLTGAFMGLMAIFFVSVYGDIEFIPGGSISIDIPQRELLLVMAFIGIVGFCTKAGMFPLHGWLPTAHPVAPAPASAVLSGLITKAGVLVVIRLVYYVFGTEFLKDTWVQYAWISLILITIVMGSMMAYNEKILKKRLAYSTVSQVSYILLGLALMNDTAFVGSMLHICFHAVLKVGLFLGAGVIIFKTGIKNVDDLSGIGKKLPITMAAFSVVGLGLVGIPPLNGFISKWMIASGSLEANMNVINWLSPIMLLLSAVLTAGYLLSVSIKAFYPGTDISAIKREKESKLMYIPMLVFALLALVTGIWSGFIADFASSFVSALM